MLLIKTNLIKMIFYEKLTIKRKYITNQNLKAFIILPAKL
jgi:hypothetical protein